MKARKKVRYANPVLHVVRKKANVLAIQLEGEESIDMLASMYLNVVAPNAFGDSDQFSLLKFDTAMGVLWFQPTERPLEMTVGDWLVYDGDNLSVVSRSQFEQNYRITIRNNKREKHVRVEKDNLKGKLKRIRSELTDGYDWFVQ